MINRDQAGHLLSDVQHRPSESSRARLEAIYSAADGPAKAVLDRHPDLRLKLHGCIEARIRADQEATDFRVLVHKIRDELIVQDHDELKKKDDDEDAPER